MSRDFAEANVFQRALRRFAASGPGSWLFARILDRLDRLTFRATKGSTCSRACSARSRWPWSPPRVRAAASRAPCRCSPCRLPDGLAIIGSNYGQPKHPAWLHNLRADPEGEVDVEGRRWAFRAVEVEDERRERIWHEALRTYPGFAGYARRAAPRRISVFVLEPRDGGVPSDA